jgi:hypothetical protein
MPTARASRSSCQVDARTWPEHVQFAHYMGYDASPWAARLCHLAADLHAAPSAVAAALAGLSPNVADAVRCRHAPPHERAQLAQPLLEHEGADVADAVMHAHHALAPGLPLGRRLVAMPPSLHGRPRAHLSSVATKEGASR